MLNVHGVITYNKYQYHDNEWWSNRRAILRRSYTNISGDFIEGNTIVIINYKMEKTRKSDLIHQGLFFVSTLSNISIGGIACSDLILMSELANLSNVCEN